MLESIHNLWKDEAGPTTVEYALLLALVSLIALAAWYGVGTAVRATADTSATALTTIPAPPPIVP